MAAQKGKDILLKIGDGATPEVFTTVAGLRARTISLNAKSVDATDSDSTGRWRELLAGAGVRQASVSGSGILRDAASDAAMASWRAFSVAVSSARSENSSARRRSGPGPAALPGSHTAPRASTKAAPFSTACA